MEGLTYGPNMHPKVVILKHDFKNRSYYPKLFCNCTNFDNNNNNINISIKKIIKKYFSPFSLLGKLEDVDFAWNII